MEKLCLNVSKIPTKSKAINAKTIHNTTASDGFPIFRSQGVRRMPIADRHSPPALAGLSIIPTLLRLKIPIVFLSNSISFNTFGGTIDKILKRCCAT